MDVGKSYIGQRHKTMWLLILLSVSVTNPNDIPGKVTLEFETEQQCHKAKESMTYWLKFDTFKVTAECVKKS
jgi:hypothetical protein